MDELERRIRAARPVSGNRTLPLTDRAKRELAELIIAESHNAPKRSKGWIARSRLLGLAAVLVLAVSAGLLWPTPGQSAYASPPALVIVPIESARGDVLADLAITARDNPQHSNVPASGEEVTISMQTWVMHMEEVDGELDPDLTVVSPENIVTTLRPDGSRSTVATAGIPYDAVGNVASTEVAPGSVLWTLEHGPGEFKPTFSGPSPRDSAQIGPFLSMATGVDVTQDASSAFLAIGILLQEQRLDAVQTSALVEFLGTLPDYKVAGTATDRLDRPALVLTAVRPGEQYTDYLLLDRTSGDVLAIESVYTGNSRTDLDSPTVMSYSAWVSD